MSLIIEIRYLPKFNEIEMWIFLRIFLTFMSHAISLRLYFHKEFFRMTNNAILCIRYRSSCILLSMQQTNYLPCPYANSIVFKIIILQIINGMPNAPLIRIRNRRTNYSNINLDLRKIYAAKQNIFYNIHSKSVLPWICLPT